MATTMEATPAADKDLTPETTNAAIAPDHTPQDGLAAPTKRPRRGLRLAAIIAGAVVLAGLFFGGGLLLGMNLPGGGPGQGMEQGRFPGGGTPPEGGFGGQGGPGQGQQAPDADTDTDSEAN